MNRSSLIKLIDLIDKPNRICCLTLLNDYKPRFEKAPGSQSKHQAWAGGYIDHLEEVMNFARSLYELMNNERRLSFSLSDALLVLYLHDIEKPFKYTAPVREFKSDEEKKEFLMEVVLKYNFKLTDDHLNALKYIHGEGDDYNPITRLQGPLAAFVHICDVASARIWFDYPKK